jgi:hypothetical protein
MYNQALCLVIIYFGILEYSNILMDGVDYVRM